MLPQTSFLSLSRSTTVTLHSVHPCSDAVAIALEKMDGADPFLVQFYDGDPAYPKNWSSTKRWYLTMASGILVFSATFASSAPSMLIPTLMNEFHFSREVGNLVISLFVAGYCVGPLLWGPLSEQYGRRPIFIISVFVFMCFHIGCALAPNTASLLVFRFLGGAFAGCPLANSGAVIGDIWDAKRMGIATSIFALAPFAGPGIGPVVGGYIVQGRVHWHWLFWILTIFAGVCWLMIVFTMPETYAPALLVKKAQHMRKQTGDYRYYAPSELQQLSWGQRVESILARPFKVLFYEPMLIAVTLYMSFVYGCIYLLFEAYPFVFMEGHHLAPGPSGLTFLSLPIGGTISTMLYIWLFKPRIDRQVDAYAPDPAPPEFVLEPAMIGAPLFAAGFFWFAWTSFPTVSVWVPLSSGVLLGCGILWIFVSLLNYVIYAYLVVAASALSAVTVVRSLFGAIFPLFSNQMYEALGPQWASSLLGFIALAMTPIPFLLSRFGPTLRVKSKYVPSRPLKSSAAV